MLFVPYPYATSVEPSAITRVFEVTVHIERYGYLEDRLVFECGSLAPCTIKLGEGYMELIKPGVINEHIIRYNHVATE